MLSYGVTHFAQACGDRSHGDVLARTGMWPRFLPFCAIRNVRRLNSTRGLNGYLSGP